MSSPFAQVVREREEAIDALECGAWLSLLEGSWVAISRV